MTSTTDSGESRGAGTGRPGNAPFRFHPKLWIVAGVLLALPALAMQFSSEVRWGGEDFAIFGLILIAVGSGGVKTTASVVLGSLYSRDDPRRDGGQHRLGQFGRSEARC